MDSIKKNHAKFLKKFNKNFIDSVNEYTNEAYKSINRSLRNNVPLSDENQEIVNNIDMMIQQVEPILSPVLLYRGVSQQSYAKSDGAFISASYDETIANRFGKRHCCTLVFNIPAGSKILFIESISDHPDEKEVLIDRFGQFNVTLVKELSTLGGRDKIFISYIPPNSVQATSGSLDEVVNDAVLQINTVEQVVERVLEILPQDEYEIFKDDEDSLVDSIQNIFQQVDSTLDPDDTIIKLIIKRLAEKYS